MTDTTYRHGTNRVVYRAKQFATGLSITARLYSPSMIEADGSPFALTEVDHGLYYFDYNFRTLGIYHAVFFEDGEPTVYHTFRIRPRPW